LGLKPTASEGAWRNTPRLEDLGSWDPSEAAAPCLCVSTVRGVLDIVLVLLYFDCCCDH
jgi:hypothetical protein